MMDNGHDLDGFRRMAELESARQMAVQLALQQAISNPWRIQRIEVCAIGVMADDDDGTLTLALGLPTGERIDVPLLDTAVENLKRGLEHVFDSEE